MDESISGRIGEWWTDEWVESQMNERVLVSFLPNGCVVVAAQVAPLQSPGKNQGWGSLRDRPEGKCSCQSPSNTTIPETSPPFLWATICHPSIVVLRGCEAGHASRRPGAKSMAVLNPDIPATAVRACSSSDTMSPSRCLSSLVSNRAAVRSLHYLSVL